MSRNSASVVASRSRVSPSSTRSSTSDECRKSSSAFIHSCASSAVSAQKRACREAVLEKKPWPLASASIGETENENVATSATSFSAGGGSSGITSRSS